MQITGASPWTEVLKPRREQALQAVLTCIRLRDGAIEPRFQELVIEIIEQLDQAPGLIGWSMADADAHVHLTLSAWIDHRSLAAFMRQRPHVDVMSELHDHGMVDAVRFDASGADVPLSWDGALERLA